MLISKHEIDIRYRAIRRTLERAAVKHDYDVKYFRNGGAIVTGGYYKLLQEVGGSRARLVAVTDPLHLTGRSINGRQGLYLAYPDKVRIVAEYETLPALRQHVRADLIGDRPRWHNFMVRYGNLIKIPVKADETVVCFKNDFVTYVSHETVNHDGTHGHSIYVHFGSYGKHAHAKVNAKTRRKAQKTDGIEDVKKRGLYLGHIKGDRIDIENYIHRDFCKRFARFLDGKNPLTPQDVRKNFLHCIGMEVNRKLGEFDYKDVGIETYRDNFEWVYTVAKSFSKSEVLISFSGIALKFILKLLKSKWQVGEALLPESHPDHSQKFFPPNEVRKWRILDSREAEMHPDDVTVYNSVAEGWIQQDMLSAINSPTPCTIEHVGKEVFIAQKPDGTGLYHDTEGETDIVFRPRRKLEPIEGSDPDMFGVSQKHACFYEAWKVACLRVSKKSSKPADAPSSEITAEDHSVHGAPLVDKFQIIFKPFREAYKEIAFKAGCDADWLIKMDGPGTVPDFIPIHPIMEIPADEPEAASYVKRIFESVARGLPPDGMMGPL